MRNLYSKFHAMSTTGSEYLGFFPKITIFTSLCRKENKHEINTERTTGLSDRRRKAPKIVFHYKSLP